MNIMTIIKHLYISSRYSYPKLGVMLLFITLLISSCSSDTDVTDSPSVNEDKSVVVTLHLSTSPAKTRAEGDPVWTDGEAGENMKSYTIVITDNTNKIVKVLTNTLGSEKTEEAISGVSLSAGSYTFYSFANITGLTFTEGATFDENQTYTSNALAYNTDKSSGIPMSNKQTITVTSGTTDIYLYTIRMMAKLEFQIKNDTGQNVEITKVSVSDITNDITDNIFLLPKYTGDYSANKVCEPNISSSATYSEQSRSVTETISNSDTKNIVFYVNESQARSPLYHVITIDMNYSGKSVQQRYAMLDWQYIARNDWRVIPITLTDYVFTCDVEAFTAIGVLPDLTSAYNSLSVTFNGTYGEFHIKPSLKKLSDGTVIEYDPTGTDNTKWHFPSDIFESDNTLVSSLREDNVSPSILSKDLTWTPSTKYFEAYMSPNNGTALRTLNIVLPGGKTMKYKIQLTKK